MNVKLASAVVATTMLAAVQAAAQQVPINPQWVQWNADTRTATVALISGLQGGKSPFNFNGYTDGELTLTVPEGATVVMKYENEDGVAHSAVVGPGKKPIPNMAEQAAIPRAYTTKAAEGLPQGGKDTMRFKAEATGKYYIYCGVPGHGPSGMFITMVVDPKATRASFAYTPKESASR